MADTKTVAPKEGPGTRFWNWLTETQAWTSIFRHDRPDSDRGRVLVMPAFWPDYPKSFYPQMGGNADAQILAIRDHLLTFRGGPSPKAGAAKNANNN